MTDRKHLNWVDEFQRLWNELVPRRGQASTLQGELVRITGKLTDQAYRNGNMNWDADHERMWRFVGDHLDDPDAFNEDERAAIRTAIAKIIDDHDIPDLSGHGSCYYLISECVVNWCLAHPESIPHKLDPGLER